MLKTTLSSTLSVFIVTVAPPLFRLLLDVGPKTWAGLVQLLISSAFESASRLRHALKKKTSASEANRAGG